MTAAIVYPTKTLNLNGRLVAIKSSPLTKAAYWTLDGRTYIVGPSARTNGELVLRRQVMPAGLRWGRAHVGTPASSGTITLKSSSESLSWTLGAPTVTKWQIVSTSSSGAYLVNVTIEFVSIERN